MIRTERLLLRQWLPEDLDAWAALNADPAVMATLGPVWSREQAAIWLGYNLGVIETRGWGLWAVEVVDGPAFVGFVGLKAWSDDNLAGVEFTPCVEVGWRIASDQWGKGYAPEAGAAALAHGFDVLGLEEIVSMTATVNIKSRRVMEKLGMVRDPADDFEHPRASGDLAPHVLYRIRRDRGR